jgi:hypothetical protein
MAFLVVPVSALFLNEYGAGALAYVYLAVAAVGVAVSASLSRAQRRVSLAAMTAGVFWIYLVPLNLAMPLAFIALMFVRGRRTNIALLILTIALYMMPYWSRNAVSNWVLAQFG